MAKLSNEEIIEAIKELSVTELNDLVKACEDEFGVSASAGVAGTRTVVPGVKTYGGSILFNCANAVHGIS